MPSVELKHRQYFPFQQLFWLLDGSPLVLEDIIGDICPRWTKHVPVRRDDPNAAPFVERKVPSRPGVSLSLYNAIVATLARRGSRLYLCILLKWRWLSFFSPCPSATSHSITTTSSTFSFSSSSLFFHLGPGLVSSFPRWLDHQHSYHGTPVRSPRFLVENKDQQTHPYFAYFLWPILSQSIRCV